jgi:acetyl esterase/lipase
MWFKTALLIISGIALTQPAHAQQPGAKLEDPPWIKLVAPQRIVYRVPGMERIKPRRDLVYKRVAGEELKADVYVPPARERAARLPAIILIHGGRVPANLLTKPKEWGVFVSYGQLLAASGFVGVTFNHRFYKWESLSDSQSDVMDMIEYVRSNAESLGVDKNRIVLWAFSAGGIFLSQPLRATPPYVRCMVAYYAELDLQNQRQSAPASVTDETLRDFSPVYQLSRRDKGIPPIFVARAGRDDPSLNSGVDRFIQETLGKNVTIDVSNHAEGRHAFDVLDDNARTREIIKRTIDFLRAHCE